MDRYASRIFDPNAGSGSVLVASFNGQLSRPALTEEERNYLDTPQAREIQAVMRQRHGVCG